MLSVIIPFYNEEQNIPLILEEFRRLSKKYPAFELICINDGSKDKTVETFNKLIQTAQYPFLKFISYLPNAGYGHAIMTGVRAAQGDVISWTHSDMQTPIEDVFVAYSVYLSSADKKILVKGWRINRSLSQVIMSFGMAAIASVILHRRLSEINAQPKLFPRDMLDLLKDAPEDFSLDLYLLCAAQNNGYKIKTIKVRFPGRLHGQSSWSGTMQGKYKTIWRSIKYIWKLKQIV
jgi:polyisoprenyl-phosphate glycosyltransferase